MNQRIRRVSELLDGVGGWNTPLIHETFDPIDADVIVKIKPSRHGSVDVIVWQPEKSGLFTVKSAYGV
jgi:hypothetical protein